MANDINNAYNDTVQLKEGNEERKYEMVDKEWSQQNNRKQDININDRVGHLQHLDNPTVNLK